MKRTDRKKRRTPATPNVAEPNTASKASEANGLFFRIRRSRTALVLVVLLLVPATYLSYRSLNAYQLRRLAWEASEARQAGRWLKLEDVSLRWAKKDPSISMPWLLAAEAAERTGKVGQMVEYLERVPAGDERTPNILLDVATIYFGELNEPEKGVATLDRVLEIQPDSAEAHRRLLFYYGITVRRARITEIARQAITRRADNLETYVYLIGANWLTFSNAFELNQKWTKSGENVETYAVAEAMHWRGTAAVSDQGQPLSDVDRDRILNEQHAELLAKQLDVYPTNSELLAYFLERESVRNNVQRVQQLLERVPISAANDNRFWHFRGWLYAASGEFAEAAASYRKSLELNPYAWRSQFELADVLRKTGDFKEVERLSKLAILGKALQKTILQLPDVQSVPLDVFKQMLQYAEGCRDTVTVDLMQERLTELENAQKTTQK